MNNCTYMNEGVVVKVHAGQKYTSDGMSMAVAKDLDHNALVHVGAVVHIGIFRVVGVHGVGVVGAEHEAGSHRKMCIRDSS